MRTRAWLRMEMHKKILDRLKNSDLKITIANVEIPDKYVRKFLAVDPKTMEEDLLMIRVLNNLFHRVLV